MDIMNMDVIKSDNDARSYKRIVLENKLEVIIIEDPDADKAAASLSVAVGSYMNPNDTLGLAHFLEHMVFMGTEKYPDTKYFMQFINDNGGLNNAHTANEYTTYFYTINNNKLIESLDIFAQFFISPLFNELNVEREMKAVNSEHSKNLNNDSWRGMRMLTNATSRNHPMHKFGTGNLETLDHDDIRKRLINFFNKYYSSNVMKLVVLSNIETSKMENFIMKSFGLIKNNNYKPQKYKSKPFENNSYKESSLAYKLIKWVPIRDEDTLTINWQLSPTKKYFMYKSVSYLSHIFSHEGKNSLTFKLKKMGWVYYLLTSTFSTDITSHIFSLDVKLTSEGYQNVPTIISMIYQYVNLISTDGIQKWRYDEIKQMATIYFNTMEKEAPMEYVLTLSENLLYYPYQNVINAAYFYADYDDTFIKLINNAISSINPNNSIVMIGSKKNSNMAIKMEKYYQIPFIDKTNPELYGNEFYKNNMTTFKMNLPTPNKWIPTNVKMIEPHYNGSTYPSIVDIGHDNIKFWFKNDDKFNRPEVNLEIVIRTDFMIKDIKDYCRLRIFLKLINAKLESKLYYANLAGSSILYSMNLETLTISVFTYPSRLYNLLSTVTNILTKNKLNIDEDMFFYHRDEIINNYQNYIYSNPSTQAKTWLSKTINSVHYNHQELINTLSKIKLSDIDDLYSEIKSNNSIECFIMGNVSHKLIKTISPHIKNLTEHSSNNMIAIKINDSDDIKNKKISNYVLNNEEPDSAIIVSYIFGKVDKSISNWEKKAAKFILIENLTKERFFNDLRTVQQSGYIVKSNINNYGGTTDRIYAMEFLVQSSTRKLTDIEDSIDKFINDTLNYINDMTVDNFEKIKTSLIKSISRRYDNMGEEFSEYSDQIYNQEYIFDIKNKNVDGLNKISKNDILNTFNHYFINDTRNRMVSKVISRKN
jgi:insulysin